MVLRLRGRGRVGRCQLRLQMSNVQLRISNFEIRHWAFDILTFPRAVRTLATRMDTSSLAPSNRSLAVNEVLAGLGCLGLTVVRERRSPTARDLRADVPGDRSRRKTVRERTDPHGEVDQTILEIVAGPGHGGQSVQREGSGVTKRT